MTQTFPGSSAYHGDTSTFFVPSVPVLLELVRERGFRVEVARQDDLRALLLMRVPA